MQVVKMKNSPKTTTKKTMSFADLKEMNEKIAEDVFSARIKYLTEKQQKAYLHMKIAVVCLFLMLLGLIFYTVLHLNK